MMRTRTKKNILEKAETLNQKNDRNQAQKEESLMFLSTAVEIGNKILCCIPVKYLKIDHEMYQRPLQKNFKYLLDNWDDNKCDALTVNYREDGFFYVINGQHRSEVARMKGITQLVCDVFVGLTLKEEAELFVGQYDGTSKLSPIDSYRANIIRGEKIDTLIGKVCDRYGIRVTADKGTMVLGSLTVARRILKPVKDSSGKYHTSEDNTKILEWIFDIFRDGNWNGYKDTYNADMMQALWYIWRNNQGNLHTAKNRLTIYFQGSSPKELKAIGNLKYPDCGHGGGIYRVMMDIVNGETPLAA